LKNKQINSYSYTENEDANLLAKNLISSPIIATSNTNSKLQSSKTIINRNVRKFSMETLVLPKSDQSTPKRSSVPPNYKTNERFIASTPLSKVSQNQISSPTNVSTIKYNGESFKQFQNGSRLFASAEDLDGSILATSASQETSIRTIPSISSISSTPQTDVLVNSSQYSAANQLKSYAAQSSSITPKRNSIIKLRTSIETENISNDESNLPPKISNEKQTLEKEEKDHIISNLKEEYENKIETLMNQNKAELEIEKETFLSKLLNEKENHRRDVETAKTKAKNSANKTISQLNKQIVLERAKMFSEQQENSKHIEEEFRMKEDRLNQSLALFEESLMLLEEREQAWEGERVEVLTEVQRLKAEATRMVTILAINSEEDNLREDKKISLSQEVYSLQLVVEMRTGEVRNLREQQNRATQQLEEAEVTKEKLKKATARMEDLEEQIKIKNKVQKQLYVENNQLQLNLSDTSKFVDTMNKNVESLQWRIRNKFDLPVDNLTHVTSDHERPTLPAHAVTQYNQKSYSEVFITRPQSSPAADTMREPSQEKTSFVMGCVKLYDATIANTNIKYKSDDADVTSDFSPCSDSSNTSFADEGKNIGNSTEKNVLLIDGAEHHDGGVDSDEGVSDISSDGEHPDSPSFQENLEIPNSQSIGSGTLEVKMEESDQKVSDLSIHFQNKIDCLQITTARPEMERIPSRFSFGK